MKNIKLIALIALMMGGMTMKAQDYHPIVEDGKQWNVLFTYPWSPPEPPHRYTNIYKIEGDTLLDGISYKVMYTTRNEDLTGWNCWGFIRETEDGQVFSRRSSSSDERMMYDFSMQVGDTIFMYEEYMTVIETSEVFVGDEPRQQIVLEYPFGGTETWIEGIGSLYGITGSGSQFLVGGSTDLLCYYENGDLIWQNTSLSINSCYFVYSGGGQQSGLVVTPTVLTFDEPAVPQTFTISNQFDNDVTITSIYVQPDDSIVLVSHANLPQTLQPNESMTVEVELNAIGNKGYNSYHIYMLTSEGAKVVVVRVNENAWYEDFLLDNTRWAIYYQNLYLDWAPYIQIGIKGDTIVDGITYHKVIKCTSYGTVIDGDCFGGIRVEADGKWYFRLFTEDNVPQYLCLDMEPNTERLIYDFSLSVCDRFNFAGYEYEDPEYWMSVFEIDEIEINGSTRKRFWFDDDCEEGDHPYDWNWIEGIGSNGGLLYSIQAFPLDGSAYHLGEVYQDGELIYSDPYFHNYVPMVHESNDRQKWNVVYISSVNWPNDYHTEIQSIRDNITLDGVDYKLVWTENVNESKKIAGAVREEDKRVYYRRKISQNYQDEVLLYDFNLTVGDTVNVNWIGQKLGVLEESEVQVNGNMRRMLGLAEYYEDGTIGEVEEYWIEGVGSTYGLLNSGYEAMVGAYIQLLCYHENGNLIWDNEEFDDCVMNSDGAITTFAPQGAEWYFDVYSYLTSPTTYYHMEVLGDTLIQGHQCSVITQQYLGGNGDEQFVYEDNDVVYWYNQTLQRFTTLYDFNAEEGESWICDIDSCMVEVTVEDVEEVTWEGHTYRVQWVSFEPGEEFYYDWNVIIEGIGYVDGLFPYPLICSNSIYDGPYMDYLRCYLVDGEMLYHEGDLECDAVLPWQYPCWDGTVAEAYDGGNGTAEDPYQIATPQQLALLAQQTNDGTGGDAYYLLTDDICLNANLEMWYINWKPIGRVTDSAVANFKGHFDGNGKTISKLLCETNEMMTDPVIGLFGCTDGAEIVNVNLSDCRLTGGEYAGGLVGYAGSTHISNCSVQNSQITTTGGVAGGIVGYAGMPFGIYEINENVSIITNCEINLITVESSVDAGGIVGKVNDDSYYARYLISNCNANNEQYFHVKGSVSGGIVGEMSYGTIKGCASKTIVVGTGQVSNVCVGGIAGSIHGSTVIANSYNRGNVVADFEFAGGIVGYSAGNVYNVYNAGEIHMPDPNSSGYGTIIGNVQAGERLNCYWLENDLPSAGNPIQPDMPGSTAFHQGSTSTSWMLNEPQYDTSDLLEALNLGQHDDYLWLEDVDMANGGLPIPVQIEPGLQLNGSEWYYEILNADGSITYQYMYQAGDTIVQDEPTHILVKINTLYDKGEHQEVTHEYVYERDGKVYWWNKALDEFTVLYDLDAQQGDSWVIKVGTESLTMHVDAVEQYEYEGRIYKMLQVSDEGDIFSGMIVCGIGHLTSFFPERLMNRGKGFRVEGIRCYWRDSELVFKYGDKDCNEVYQEYHIGIEEDGPSTGSGTFTVYPNPTNGVLTIHHSAFIIQYSTFRITNLMGQTLLTGQITSDTQQIDVTNLPEGMYFITFAGETRKFVIR